MEVMAEHRAVAAMASERPVSRIAAAAIIGIWVLALVLAGVLAWRYLR
jgi:hypothetical protein